MVSPLRYAAGHFNTFNNISSTYIHKDSSEHFSMCICKFPNLIPRLLFHIFVNYSKDESVTHQDKFMHRSLESFSHNMLELTGVSFDQRCDVSVTIKKTIGILVLLLFVSLHLFLIKPDRK